MDYNFHRNSSRYTSQQNSNQKYSFPNNSFFVSRDPCDSFDRDYEELEKLFKPEYEDASLFKTNEISRMLKMDGGNEIGEIIKGMINDKNKDLAFLNEKDNLISKIHFNENKKNKEKENEIKIDKINKESSYLNEREIITSKNFFENKKEKPEKIEIVIDTKYKEPSKLNQKEDKISFDEKNDNDEKESNIIIDKTFKESIQSKIKKHILSKRPFKEKKTLGRKRKENEGLGEHNKFSDDNIIRKIKHVILDNVMKFINKKIKLIYFYRNEKILKDMELFKLKLKQNLSSKSEYNKGFLDKKLGEIFSDDISSKYSRYPSSHNRELIKSLLNEEEERRRIIFCKLFNLTFADCLNHFRGSKKFEELEGLSNLDNYLKSKKMVNNKEYCDVFKYFVTDYERVIMGKKSRNRIKK